MSKWIAEFDLEDGDTMPEHMDLEYKGARIDFHCRPLEQEPTTKNDSGVDLISRADAIKAMQDKAKKLKNEDTINGLCGAVAILFDLPSVTPQEPRWIPVSEYLPVTNDEVLVTYIVNGNAKKRYVETANCFDGEWSSVNDEYRIPNTKIEIIAWCEMPKPYREVDE